MGDRGEKKGGRGEGRGRVCFSKMNVSPQEQAYTETKLG